MIDFRKKFTEEEVILILKDLEARKRFKLSETEMLSWVRRLIVFPAYKLEIAVNLVADSGDSWIDCGKVVTMIRTTDWSAYITDEDIRMNALKEFNEGQKKLGYQEVEDGNRRAVQLRKHK